MSHLRHIGAGGFVGLIAVAVMAVVLLRSGTGSAATAVAEPVVHSGEPVPVFTDRSLSWQRIDNPMRDGWQTEAFSDYVVRQFKQLGQLLTKGQPIKEVDLAALVAPGFGCGPLVPEGLRQVFHDGVLEVERSDGVGGKIELEEGGSYRGAAGLASAFQALISVYVKSAKLHVEFKLFGVERSGQTVTTRQFVEIAGRTTTGLLERHATWVSRWQLVAEAGPPRLVWIGVDEFEQVRRRGAARELFADCTESVLGGNDCYPQQLLYGFNHWLNRIAYSRYYDVLSNPGLAVGDVNGDGLDDLYLCQETGLPNRLFIQRPDATLQDVSVEAGVDWLHSSRGALLVDLDNDGDEDLAVAIEGGVVLAANDGQGRFEIRDVLDATDDTMSLAAADYDGDGRLDVYVCAYYPERLLDESNRLAVAAVTENFVYHNANTAGANSLFRNQTRDADHWQFTDVTQQVGLDVNNSRYSFAAAWEDFDNDGDQDLYVGNDFGHNNLYRNDEGRFVDVAAPTGTEDSAFGMSVTWGDYDRDGFMDLYVSNMFSSAGSRITTQDRFHPGASAQMRAKFQHLARGNTLFHNLGDGKFRDVSVPAGVTMGRWAWGSNFVDLNNDGWEDLFVANGYITTEDTGDL